jgi:hypothetical protein
MIYCGIVLLLVIGSLGIKFFTLFKDSKFDSHHEFIIAFEHQKELDVVAFHPVQKSLSHLQIRGIRDLNETEKTLGVFFDSSITLNESFSMDHIASYLSDAMVKHRLARSPLSTYDLLKLSLFAKGIPESQWQTEEIALPLEQSQIDQFAQELFTDQTFSTENKSVQIVNGTGVPGLGTRLGRQLGNRGLNVISIINADDPTETSEIRYFGDKTYTVERLSKMLSTPATPMEKQTLSDIIITIGADKVSLLN